MKYNIMAHEVEFYIQHMESFGNTLSDHFNGDDPGYPFLNTAMDLMLSLKPCARATMWACMNHDCGEGCVVSKVGSRPAPPCMCISPVFGESRKANWQTLVDVKGVDPEEEN